MSLRALASLKEHLTGVPGVAGVGVSSYRAGELGVVGSEEVVVVYVERYEPELVRKIPSEVHGLRVVVVPSGRFRVLAQRLLTVEEHRLRYRPIMGGISCGSLDVGAGTLSCIVYDRLTGSPLGLSNNHVICQAFEGSGFVAYRGKPIIQPGRADGGAYPGDVVGYLERWVPVRLGVENTVDCAVFTPTVEVSRGVLNLVDEVPPSCDVAIGDRLRKSGRTTGVTDGVVESVHATVSVEAWGREYVFTDVVITRSAIAEPGDSGSFCLDLDRRGSAGIVFAGSELKTAVIPAVSVERELGVSFTAVPPAVQSIFSVVPIGLALYFAVRER